MSMEEPFSIQDYKILQVLGEGCYGKVLHCFKPHLPEAVAVKMIKQGNETAFRRELYMLQHVRALDPDVFNVVRFIESFDKCLAFEMLDISLYDLMRQTRSLPLMQIRAIAQQLLVAFDGLKQLGVVHTDLKLDNVMLVNHKSCPLKVRLIDFGQARRTCELQQGMNLQPRSYKAPEVSLGLPLSEAIDMWSLGCVLTELYLGVHPFLGCPYENQRTILEVLGFPPHDLLSLGMFTGHYYIQQEDGQWRFKTPYEFQRDSQSEVQNHPSPLGGSTLAQRIRSYPNTREQPEWIDRIDFLSFVHGLLHPDYRQRLTPRQALNHPFITLRSLWTDNSDYANMARAVMIMVTGPCAPQNAGEYRNLQVLGNGVFQCLKTHTSEIAVLKGVKTGHEEAFDREERMIRHIRTLDSDKCNIVRCVDSFVQSNQRYLAFEVLDTSLSILLAKRSCLKLSEIRPIARQLLVAFDALGELGVVYTDLTLDNVMLVNHKMHPWKVKLMNFRAAYLKSELTQETEVQPKAYQAPEVTLGLPLSEAMDMWSLGCVLVHLFLGVHPFSESPYENQRSIIDALGFPPGHLLSQGSSTHELYSQNEDGEWSLKTPEEMQLEQPLSPAPLKGLELDKAILSCPNVIQNPEFRDRLAFLSLCESLLNLDSERRLTPSAALYHPFITMAHLEGNLSDYTSWARDLMVMTNNSSSGPQESSGNSITNEDHPLEELQHREQMSHAVLELPCDTDDGEIKNQPEGKISKTSNDPVCWTQQTSNPNPGHVVIVMEDKSVDVAARSSNIKSNVFQEENIFKIGTNNRTEGSGNTENPGLKEEEPEDEPGHVTSSNTEDSADTSQSSVYSRVTNGLWSVANYIVSAVGWLVFRGLPRSREI